MHFADIARRKRYWTQGEKSRQDSFPRWRGTRWDCQRRRRACFAGLKSLRLPSIHRVPGQIHGFMTMVGIIDDADRTIDWIASRINATFAKR